MLDTGKDFSKMVKEISSDISEKIRGLSPTSHCKQTTPTITIFTADSRLPDFILDRKHYEPKLVSIGPYHHGKDHLHKMEQEKLRCLKTLVSRQKSSVCEYVDAVMSVEEDARKCYSKNPVEFSPDKFVEMLVLDGCFIVELIRKYKFVALRDEDDIMILNQLELLCRDLMLLENQVPFFVLDRLFNMTRTENSKDNFLYLFRCFINDNAGWPVAKQPIGEVSMKNVDHMLGLVHRILCSSRNKLVRETHGTMFSCSTLQREGIKFDKSKRSHFEGIKFDKSKKSHFLDIKFIRGTLIIPQLSASNETESIFENLIAYEWFLGDAHPCYITNYVVFMNCLIKTSEDADILCRNGITRSLMKSCRWDHTVCLMVIQLALNLPSQSKSKSSIYGDVYEKVFKYRGRRSARACRCL